MLSSPHYVSIRQHTSAYVCIRQRMLTCCLWHAVITRPSEGRCCAEIGYFHSAVGCQQQVLRLYISMYNAVLMQILEACIRQNTSASGSMRQHTAAYGSIRQHTSDFMCPVYIQICISIYYTYTHTHKHTHTHKPAMRSEK
jgi:hypothetical protein